MAKKKLTNRQADEMLAKSAQRHEDPKDLDYMPANFQIFAEEKRKLNEWLNKKANRAAGAKKAAATRAKSKKAAAKKTTKAKKKS